MTDGNGTLKGCAATLAGEPVAPDPSKTTLEDSSTTKLRVVSKHNGA